MNLEGMKMKFKVMKQSDVTHLTADEQMMFTSLLMKIEEGRKQEGQKENTYLVINTDEPYANEVVEVLQRHGHWG